MTKVRRVADDGEKAQTPTKRRKVMTPAKDVAASKTVEEDSNLLHLLHSSSGVGAESKDLPTRESTESTQKQQRGGRMTTTTKKKILTSGVEDDDKNNKDGGEGGLKEGEIDGEVKIVDKSKTSETEKNNSNKKEGEDDIVMENGDDNEDEDEDCAAKTIDLVVTDNFFTREPFTPTELEAVEEAAKEKMESSVALLEKEGYSVFKKWRSKEQIKTVSVKVERKRMEQAIQDAKISGAPREYQQRLFEIACKQNTIIHLGTGAGKTLIALMTIRHFAKDYEKGKQTLFMVPSVALAIQQSTVLRSNLPYSVQVACYSTSTTAKARKALQECQIVVATHGAINDLLMHYGDLFKMQNFNLLVMDECHYAIGSHTYATVMKRFFHTLPEKDRPRVLGLTASPLVKVKLTHSNDNLATMLQSLEQILTATVVSPFGGDKESEQMVPRFQRKPAQEKDIIFTAYLPRKRIPCFDTFGVHHSRERELAQLLQLYDDLGPLAMSIYCQTLAREVSRNSFERESPKQFQNLVKYFQQVAQTCDKLCRDCPHRGRSDKLLALEELMEEVIEDNGSSDTVVLIFVERRITAMALNDFFKFRQKASAQGNWKRASEARKLQPILRSNGSSPVLCPPPPSRRSSTSESSAQSSPSVEILGSSPTNSMDQFADAEDDMEIEVSTKVSVENQEEIVREESRQPSKGPPGNQFDDASDDDESQGAIQQYLEGIRRQPAKANASDRFADDDGGAFKVDAAQKNENGGFVIVSGGPNDLDNDKTGGPNENDEMDIDMDSFEIFDKQVFWNTSLDQFDGASVDFSLPENESKESIRCQALVRNSTHIFKSLNIARRLNKNGKSGAKGEDWLHQESKIRDVLAGLRRGDINVLIATSVVEEGVDVQACSCVVAFDSLRSAKGYVQMRGRARAKNAKFFVFKDVREQSTTLSLDSAQEIEKRVHQFITSRVSKVSIKDSSFESTKEPPPPCKSDCAEIRAVKAGIYTAKSGSVDLQYAKSLVNRYILSLPIDPSARCSKVALAAHLPSYSDRELYLPSHLPTQVRRILLPEAYWDLGRKDKEAILALMACVRLHVHGLLSERLLPLTRTDLQEMMLTKATQEPRNIPLKTLGSFGVNGTKKRRLFVYPLMQKNTRIGKLHKILGSKGHSLAVLALEKLPNIPTMRVAHSGFGTVTCSIGDGVFSVECSEGEFEIILRFFKLMMDSRWRRRTKNVFFRPRPFEGQNSMIPPYFVACLSAAGKLDFTQMVKLIRESRRSEEERIEAVRSASDVKGLPEPRLWAPLYDKNFTYISYGPSGKVCSAEFPNDRDDKDEVATYEEYFLRCRNYEVKDDCLLFDAQRLWVLPFSKVSTEIEESDEFEPKKLAPSVHSTKHVVCKELKSLLLPKDACMEIAMADPNFLLLTTHLPQFLNHMEVYLTAHSFTEHCKKHLPRLAGCLSRMSAEQIAETLTAKSCAEEGSYEKLEWLGDAVLKLVQTDSLMYSKDFAQWIEFLHEGDLSTLRSVMGCNDRLAVACKRLKIDHFLLTSPFGRGQWAPSTLDLYSPTTAGSDNGKGDAMAEPIGEKTFADVIEAILGIVYLECGYEEATAVADELEISLPQVDDRSKALPDRNVQPKPRLLAVAKSFTGHSIKRPDLVQEAFTHPTAMHPAVPSYQRLEWVGDAVLCLAAREWIYKRFPSMEVGQMVSMEASLVSNETLAFLSIKHGLLQHLDHCDQTLPGKIEHQLWITEELCRGLWGTDPPKVAADIVESLLGAVYLDAGFAPGVAAVSKILSPLYQCLERIFAKDNDHVMMHPKKAMQEIGGSLLALKIMREEEYASRKPDSRVWLGRRWGAPRPDSQHYVATVECLDFDVVSVADFSAEVAGNRACAFAVAMLNRAPSLSSRVQMARTMVESSSSREKKQAEAGDATLNGQGSQESMDASDSKSDSGEPPHKSSVAECTVLEAAQPKGKSPEQMPEDDTDKIVKSVVDHVLEGC